MSDRPIDDEAVQQPTEPCLCNVCRQFFGNASSLGMCSKCFRENQHSETQTQEAVKSIEAAAAFSASSLVTPQTTPVPAPESPGVTVAAPAAVVAEDSPQPPQKKPNRCFTCNKKIGLTGFKCRCNYIFCSEHRYSDKHNCTFDYKSAGRDAIAKANPTVVADKVQKI
ncbi:hypothetical protein CYMTET_25470 [Cymbomonas tetramitiformis]|uniref:Uncharacterized protein n=1 Tax=Cymbomonas tetramitiformis TaxID=36881 RepID=A0AAE0KZ06_9CHLO|nr:hypothetical protein CYMTET_25470 [Cymbomonas tetramitiformis]